MFQLEACVNLRSIFAALEKDGEETRVVGGALRNALIARPVHEIDLATTLLPKAIAARATFLHLFLVSVAGLLLSAQQGYCAEIKRVDRPACRLLLQGPIERGDLDRLESSARA